jgi:hypothetical protein
MIGFLFGTYVLIVQPILILRYRYGCEFSLSFQSGPLSTYLILERSERDQETTDIGRY